MNLTGETKIWRKDFNNIPSYTMQIKNSYDSSKTYLKVQLPKDFEVENGAKINITKSFLGCYNYNGETRLKLIVMECDLLDEQEQQYAQEEREAIQNEDSYNVDFSSDLPF